MKAATYAERVLKVNHAGENGAVHIIAATTAAVERVVLAHLQDQLHALEGQDNDAVAAISSIVTEEAMHLAQSESHLDAGRLWPGILTPIVAASTESVIWLGMRL